MAILEEAILARIRQKKFLATSVLLNYHKVCPLTKKITKSTFCLTQKDPMLIERDMADLWFTEKDGIKHETKA